MWNPATQTNNSKTPEPVKAAAVTTPVNFEPPPATGPRGVTTNHQQEQATIGKSLVVKGEVTGSESLYVDGRVEGTAREIVVLGAVTGNLTASDRVEVRSEGSLTGDVSCQRISIEDGAFFKGGIDVRKPAGKENGSAHRDELTSAMA